MKKFLILIIIVIIFCVFSFHNNNNPKIIISRLLKMGDIHSGELKYRVYMFGIVPVGEATFGVAKEEEYEGGKVLHLSASAKSLNYFAKIFSAQATLDSYIDMQQFSPMFFRQEINISGKSQVVKEVFYDQRNGVMSIGNIKRHIPPNTNDPLSAAFNLRKTDFDKVKELELNLNTNQKTYTVKGTAIQQKISINNNPFNITTLNVDIFRKDKNPYHKSSVTMLLTKEENIPVLIKVFASGIFISAKLVDIK
jgi:hypothetical protein